MPNLRQRLPTIIVLFAIGALLTLFVALMPRGYDTNLGRIGQGQPVAVLTHDPGLLASTQLMESVNGLRRDFEPALLFLAADAGTPEGRQFAEQQAVNAGVLVLFDARGRRLASYSNSADTAGLRRFLEQRH